MQLVDTIQFTLSRDTGSSPQDILSKKYEASTDSTNLVESVTFDQPFPVATTVLSMGTIAQGRFMYIKPAADVSILFNGGVEPIVFRGGKASKMWINFTSASIVVTGAAVQTNIVIAGL